MKSEITIYKEIIRLQDLLIEVPTIIETEKAFNKGKILALKWVLEMTQ